MTATYDVLIVGGGPGGYVAAVRAATHGARVLLADPAPLGGVCLHEGCIPSKVLLHAAALAAEARAASWLTGADSLAVDVAALQEWKGGIVTGLSRGVGGLLASRGVEVVAGRVRFTGARTALLDEETEVAFERAVIATGSEAVALSALPFDKPGVLGSREVLALTQVPGRVVVVGAGYVGLELATLLHDLGSEVTIVEAADRALPAMEPGPVHLLLRELTGRGVVAHLSTVVEVYDDGVVRARSAQGPVTLEADAVVVAVGRRPVTRELGLDALGLTTDGRGFLPVDRSLRTTVPHVFAIGDVTPGPALAHRAMAQGKVAGANAAGRDEVFAPAAVPGVVYTRPELASVGLTSTDATAQGLDVEVTTFSLSANGRVRSLSGTGTAVAVSERGTGLLLGLHVLAPQASELAGGMALALEMGAVAEDVADTVWPHPTVSEGLGEVADALLGVPLHALAPHPRGR